MDGKIIGLLGQHVTNTHCVTKRGPLVPVLIIVVAAEGGGGCGGGGD